jgi:hypothetical protein
MRIHRPDCLLDPIVEGVETMILPIGGLVDGVVARDPSIALVVLHRSVNRRPRAPCMTQGQAGIGTMDP